MPLSPRDLTQRHLSKIVDSSDDAIVSKDLNGTILSWAAAERMFGYSADVHAFNSAAAALDALPAVRPDALVVDLGMPVMDGFEFIRRVRSSHDPTLAETPAAAL